MFTLPVQQVLITDHLSDQDNVYFTSSVVLITDHLSVQDHVYFTSSSGPDN
jgi:hypothetical protein